VRFRRRIKNIFEGFYGMENPPFSRDIPTDKLYDSYMMQEILGRLKYASDRLLFAVLTGIAV
jgi:general secretion pathway protein A